MLVIPLHENTPRWLVWVLNLIVLGIGALVVAGLRWAGWQFCAGLLTGFFFLFFYVRLRYGFWVEP